MSRSVRVGLVLAAFALSASFASPAEAAVLYRPPVDAPVVDAFRLPDGPYGAGNRGLEYTTVPGTPVRAIGDGLVVFAGVVAGNRAVTLLHPDGLRSSYSYLADVRVAVGTRVAIGQAVGTAGERLHLGVRSGGTYLDPAALFTATGVHLVPVGDHPSRAARSTAFPEPRSAGPSPSWWTWLTGGGAGSVAGTLARRS